MGVHLRDGEECDLVRQLLSDYIAGRLPGYPATETDTYVPVGEKLLLRINQWFGDSDDAEFPEDYVPITEGLFEK